MDNWHILIVEDDPDGQEVLSRILRHRSIPHDVAATGEEALDMVHRNPYTMAIVDLALPGLDGWGLLSAMQKDADTAQVPCVAVTAFHSPEVAVKAIDAGFLAYFPKPIEATAFIRELERIVIEN